MLQKSQRIYDTNDQAVWFSSTPRSNTGETKIALHAF